jgi:hypothetical protein
MGRPIRKDRMVSGSNDFGGDNEGKIAVTAYRTFGGSKVDSTTAYIVAQRSSKNFKIHLDDSTEVVMNLKAVAPGSLANDSSTGLGEFMVQGILDDSTVVYISKFHNNTVQYVTAGGATGSGPYVRNAEGTDEGQVSGKVNINVL